VSSLLSLGLEGTSVTDAGVMMIAGEYTGLSWLQVLRLSGTRVTDASVVAIMAPHAGLKDLGGLTLERTQVSAERMAMLRERYPTQNEGC
jgi:hypothetical protein